MIRPQTQFAANFKLRPVPLRDFAFRLVSAHIGHPVGVLAASNDGAGFHDPENARG